MRNSIIYIALLISTIVFSQSGINYKAVIKDSGGNIVASQAVDVQFIIYEGAALTNNVYQENHTTITDANGIVIVNIGEGTTTDVFTDVAWGDDEHWINVQVDTGAGLVDMGTTQFMAVPYALSSGDNYWSKNGNEIYTTNTNVGINRVNPEHTLDVRSSSITDPAGFNLSNSDKSRNLRLFSGSDTFPNPSMTWVPGNSLLFATYNDNTFEFDELMHISSAGDVGIGVDDPQARLDIRGGDWNLDAGNPGDLRIGNATANFRIGVATGGGGAGITRMYTNTNSLILGTNNAAVLTVNQMGNIGIGTLQPDESAILDMESSDQGVLIPRLTTFQRNTIVNPKNSLMIYQTDGSPGFYYNSGNATETNWKKVGDEPETGGHFERNYNPGNVDFEVPVGVHRIYFEMVAGGGGSGGTYLVTNGSNRGAGGGGGGGFASGYIEVTPGEVLALTIGARGDSGSPGTPGSSGTAGGASSISTNGTLLVQTTGGNPGTNGTASSAGTGGSGGTITDVNYLRVKLTCTIWTAVAGTSGFTADAVNSFDISGTSGCVNSPGNFNRLHPFSSTLLLGGNPTAFASHERILPYYGIGGGRTHSAQGGYIVLNW